MSASPGLFASEPAKLALLGSLYFSQGLPFGFFTQALPIVLRERGFSLGAIGLSSLLAAPWALKFLWAPAVDKHYAPSLGRRRSWIVPMQLASVALLVTMALRPSMRTGVPLLAAVFALNLLSATQDIATDGLAVDMLEPSERGLANGLQVGGYRAGMVVGGGALLVLQARLGWASTFLAMGTLIAVATVPVLLLREPARPRLSPSIGSPSVHFLRRPGAAHVLAVIVTYKVGDAFATGMLRPFLADAGLGLADIGWLLGTVGFVSGLLGALSGGALLNRLGRRRALVVFGVLQAVTVAAYAVLALSWPGKELLYVLCSAEHFAGGMGTAALFTCMMDWCSQETSATDYTVQASAVVFATGAAATLSGFSAQALGYFGHFALATVLAGASLVFVFLYFPGAEIAKSLTRGEGGERAHVRV